MSTWLWVIVGTAAFFFLSVGVSLAVAGLLGRISRQEDSELFEAEFWALASLTREEIHEEQEAPTEQPAVSERVGARRWSRW
jgi:hypothetical protein